MLGQRHRERKRESIDLVSVFTRRPVPMETTGPRYQARRQCSARRGLFMRPQLSRSLRGGRPTPERTCRSSEFLCTAKCTCSSNLKVHVGVHGALVLARDGADLHGKVVVDVDAL